MKKFAKIADAFHKAEAGLKVDKVGNGAYMLGFDATPSAKPQTPAQHAASVKAAGVSAANRKARAGLR